jgi:glycerophosphoryl diester phosphodiesterase
VSGFSLNYQTLTPSFMYAAHKRLMSVYSWTVNDKPTMTSLIDAGIDGILSNYPALVAQLLE